ncbi:uncharacterized protein LOC124844198 isoform X2 [Vigna umbellata]|uniref:uncharacterized protein LOC124844198 isoform X2 n=1 Tax=Vigna umbellata TaxID=87088 RepID=UPI001F5F68CF|nr:uncharacterized protein LOC124844198 isoform X2 [Vigna umbellata]
MVYLLFVVNIFLLLWLIVFLLEMNNQDQGRTHTRTPGLKGDDHGVHACHNGSCGAVEGFNPSDKEHLSDNDPHSKVLVTCFKADVKVTDDDQMQDPSILQGERIWEGNMLELQAEKPVSHVETLHKSINDVQVESTQFPTSSDDNTSQEIEEGYVLVEKTASLENLLGNSDVLPLSSVTHTCNDNGINGGSLDGNQGSNSDVIEIFAEMTDSGGIILHSPVQSFLPMENANRNNEPELSANEAVRVEGRNSPADTDSQNDTVRRRFNWLSCLCCCFCGDR